ncbi:MAG: two-component system response regulator [Tagaea sp. CACIAM 22H2]|nr:two-component system response regulator [Tagaea sp. CACIAM 22H2]
MKTEVLFVDDEPNVLSGLRRMLFPMRESWNMRFAGGGDDALRELDRQPADVIVTDMRMPGMDGAELLSRIEAIHPETIRIVLSGQCDRETALRAVGPTHVFLSKPCDSTRIVGTVERAVRLRDEINDKTLRACVEGLRRLPSPPQTYLDLVAELRKPDGSIANVAAIVGRDIALTAKLLQIANSAFFGVGRSIATPLQAMNFLGLDIVRALVLKAGLLAQLEAAGLNAAPIEEIVRHSLAMGALCRRLWESVGAPEATPDEAFVAGFLHDIGAVVLAAIRPELDARIREESEATQVPRYLVEREHLGTTHAQIGAHLLSIWGLPDNLTAAASYHHEPMRCGHLDFGLHSVVHIADALITPGDFAMKIDEIYLHDIGRLDWTQQWRDRLAFENATKDLVS